MAGTSSIRLRDDGALALPGLGIWRWTIVFNRRELRLDPNVVAAAGVAVLVAMFAAPIVVAVVDFDAFSAVLVVELGLGILLTLAAFVGLIVRAVGGRRADEAGVALPAYLLGCCFFLYVPFVFYEGLRVGGCFP